MHGGTVAEARPGSNGGDGRRETGRQEWSSPMARGRDVLATPLVSH
ncbi:hypothetical protein NY78_4018 [Desulfovibrio sp. TomC]|nr:hypothetical protein NY78_4018 [Desulfovibrio sp. TomC]